MDSGVDKVVFMCAVRLRQVLLARADEAIPELCWCDDERLKRPMLSRPI